MALTRKQRAFIDEYLIDFNATQAAIRAGYSEKTAYNIGWENVNKREEIRAEIDKRVAEKAMGADESLILLGKKARFDFSPYVRSDRYGVGIDLNKLIEDGHGDMIREVYQSEMGPRIKFTDPDAAHNLIIKVHGLTDKGPAGTEEDPVHVKYIVENRPADD